MAPGGAEQIEEPGKALGLRQFSRRELDHATQKKGQQTAQGVHADLLTGPLILRAHRHVLVLLQLLERFPEFALTAMAISVAPYERLSDGHRLQRT